MSAHLIVSAKQSDAEESILAKGVQVWLHCIYYRSLLMACFISNETGMLVDGDAGTCLSLAVWRFLRWCPAYVERCGDVVVVPAGTHFNLEEVCCG